MTERERHEAEEAAAHAAPSSDDEPEDDEQWGDGAQTAVGDAASDAASHEVQAGALKAMAEPPPDDEDADSARAAIADAASDAASHEVHADKLEEMAEPVPAPHDDEDDDDATMGEAATDAAAHQLDSSLEGELPRGQDVTDGELITRLEELFPLTFGAMLIAVCYIGLYFAVDQLPRRTNPLPGPDWLPFF